MFGKTLYAPLLVFFILLLVIETSSQSQPQSRIRKLGASTNGAFPHTHLYIHNYLGEGFNATVTAWSALRKFGTVTLANGETDEFGFNPSFLPSLTDVQCNITWARGSMSNEFVYSYTRDHKRCYKFCHWNMTIEGMLGINSSGQVDEHLFWKSK